MDRSQHKIKLGISRCLLGERVRYDGGHKLDHFLADTLGPFVEWAPVCPEVEAGLGIPREPMRLVGDPKNPRLMTRNTGIDHTERMKRWTRMKLRELKAEELCGFIFKSRSPSSGMERVKVYKEDGMPGPVGSGIFARAFMDVFPGVPVEDDGRLRDPGLRENFIERVFVFHRWRLLCGRRKRRSGLIAFHTGHKYLIMAHSPRHLNELGLLVADSGNERLTDLYDEYFRKLMAGLVLEASVKKNANVLQHMMGFFKEYLAADEKRELLEVIGEYRRRLVPLIVPVTLIRHYVRKYQEPYLKQQHYLNPHPDELMLRNHV